MSQKDTKVLILGDGGWGTTLALLLAAKGLRPMLWGAFSEYVDEVKRTRENRKFLPGFKIPENVSLVSDLQKSCLAADWIVLATPSQHLRKVVKKIDKKIAKNKIFVSVAKGIEINTLKTMSQVIFDELGMVRLAVISGPTIARDVALKMPSAASVASKDARIASDAREIFSTDYFRLFENSDVLGVELGGSIKNVIAICSGIVEGLGFGANTRAVLFARGIAEMARLGVKMGAERQTFTGLSGLGDLATTCLSPHSRNRWLGEEIGKGRPLKKILDETEMVVEGVETAKAAHELSKKNKVSMPICEAVFNILFHAHDPKHAIHALMKQGPRQEGE